MKLFTFKQNHQKRADRVPGTAIDHSNFKYQKLELNQKQEYLNLANTDTDSTQSTQNSRNTPTQKHHPGITPKCTSNFLFVMIGFMLGASSILILQFIFQAVSKGSAFSSEPEIVRNMPIECEI